MRLAKRRIGAFLTLAGAGGYLMAGPGTGCTSYLGESALVATDFCFIFDCQNGILGGTIDPCASSGTGPGQGPFFADCPDEQ